MSLRLRAFQERMRASLFYLPAGFIVAALVLLSLTDLADRRLALDAVPLLRTSNAENARQVLSTVAAATITVAGIVFSVMVVAVQLTSSQFSPRVLHGFLRDRFDQVVIGIVVGTFVFNLVALATTPSGAGTQDPGTAVRHLTVTVAVLLGIASILGIVAFIDHRARSLQVGHIIRGISHDTRRLIDHALPRSSEPVPDTPLPEANGDTFTVRAVNEGWVQQIDHDGLLRLLPAGTTGRLEVRVGSFVATGTPLLTVWPPPPEDERDELAERIHHRFTTGATRTMQQDIAFGIRQLVDIALRALSPGINDPTTAYDVMTNLGAVLADLLRRDLPPRVVRGEEGRTLSRPHELTMDRYVGRAFNQIRLAGGDKPEIILAMLRVIATLDGVLAHEGRHERRELIRAQARLAVDTLDHFGTPDHDAQRVRQVAEELELLDPIGDPDPEPNEPA